MAEKETLPGVFISVVTLDRWRSRVEHLRGEDLAHFVSKCNSFRLLASSVRPVIGLNEFELLQVCKDLEPEFDPETDYFVIRNAPTT